MSTLVMSIETTHIGGRKRNGGCIRFHLEIALFVPCEFRVGCPHETGVAGDLYVPRMLGGNRD